MFFLEKHNKIIFYGVFFKMKGVQLCGKGVREKKEGAWGRCDG